MEILYTHKSYGKINMQKQLLCRRILVIPSWWMHLLVTSHS